MDLRYREWLPASPALHNVVTAYWQTDGDPTRVPPSYILPDGQVEVVFNFGAPVGLVGPVYTGDQPDRAVVGPLASAIRLEYRGPVKMFGIRFHPARGAAFLGLRAAALTGKLLPLEQACAPLDDAIANLTSANWDPESAASRDALDRLLVRQLESSPPADMPVAQMVDWLQSRMPAPPVADIAREFGLSSRQVQRRFLDAVGMAPKQFVRVVRFARLWQVASMSASETWAGLAAEHGYADQAHMIREFRAFGAEPPNQLFSADWYGNTELSRASGAAKGERSPR